MIFCPAVRSFPRWVKGALLVDSSLYEEVAADESSTAQAMAVVVLASLATGLGVGARGGVSGLVSGTTVALIGWLLWAGLTHVIGTRLLPTRDTG